MERDEDPLTSVRREVLEETGLTVRDVILRAVYNIDAGSPTGVLLFVFTATSDSRDTIETDEGTLQWVPVARVLDYDLIEDLRVVMPRVLSMEAGSDPLFVHQGYGADDSMLLRFGE
jgi:8-oxo-dGTP diphosphatase